MTLSSDVPNTAVGQPQAWHGAWRALGIAVAPPDLLGDLLARWSEPHRHYHGVQHLRECLAMFDALRGHARRPGEVALGLWFHDAIYEPAAHDNEARSAAWAREALLAAGADTAAAQRVHALVMATRHLAADAAASADAAPDPDTAADTLLLLDIDLAILGAAPARFAQYEAQIRAEHAAVPQDVFEPRRRAVLQSFLDRPVIYRTAPMRATHEAQARANLAKASRSA